MGKNQEKRIKKALCQYKGTDKTTILRLLLSDESELLRERLDAINIISDFATIHFDEFVRRIVHCQSSFEIDRVLIDARHSIKD